MQQRLPIPIATEGSREIVWATLILGALALGSAWITWPLAVPFILLWVWVLSFFRDPRRIRAYAAGDLCSPADGTVTEVSALDGYDAIIGPAWRIGIFLSIFNVHVNRAPVSGRVRAVLYRPGEFLDARHTESGRRNESNTIVIDPDPPMPGPLVLRQVAGLVARRIICHAKVNDHLAIGERFGMIKFGSRTELIIPRRANTEIMVKIGDVVHGGLTIVARQPIGPAQRSAGSSGAEDQGVSAPAA